MEGASRVTRPCFDLHFDRFDGLMFKAAKPLENVCTTVRFHSLSSEYELLLSLSRNLQRLKPCCWMEWSGWQEKREIVIILLEWKIQKKSEEQAQKLARNSASFLVPLSIGTFLEGSENGPFLGLHFGAGEPLSSPFLEPQTERPCLQQCSWVAPDCSQLLLVLNRYIFQTIKLKLSAFLPNAAATVV